MNKSHLLLSFVLLTITTACVPWRRAQVVGSEQDVLEIAARDFLKNSHLLKKSSASVFTIAVSVSPHIPNHTFELFVTPITAHDIRPFPNHDTIGSFSNRLPKHYIEKKGKIVCWHDKNAPLSQDIYDKLLQHNVVDSMYFEYDFHIEHAIDGNHYDGEIIEYYFCKNDFSRFKRVYVKFSSNPNPPKMKCCE